MDCDGICSDFVAPVLVAINVLSGTDYQEDDVTSWNIYETLNVPKDVGDKVDAIIKAQGFCENVIDAYPGAVPGVAMLQEMGDVIPVTAPFDGPFWVEERKAWLHRNFGINPATVVSTHDKTGELGAVFIEDKASTLVKWQAAHPEGKGILFSRPWNVNEPWDGLRCNDWAHLVALVKSLCGGAS